jgi:integrase
VFCHPTRGSKLDADWYRQRFAEAVEAAGIRDRVRAFHDMRHTALTNLAAEGASPIAVMAIAGHRSMQTTNSTFISPASFSVTRRARWSGGCSG